MLSSSKQAILGVQLYLRRNGFPDVRIDGEHNTDFDDVLRSCMLDRACGHGIARHISAPFVKSSRIHCEVVLQMSEAAFRPEIWRLGVG